VTWIALTKLDVLSGLDKIKICTEYDLHGKTVEIAPPSVKLLRDAKPTYVELDGWRKMTKEDWKAVSERGWDALPDEAKTYIETIEKLVNKPIKLVSVGAEAGLEVMK